MPINLRDSQTLVLVLESSHLKKLFEKKEPLCISYNGHIKIKISLYKKEGPGKYPERMKRSVSYDDSLKQFVIFLDEQDIPIDALDDYLQLTLPTSCLKVTTLFITCPFSYKR